MSSEKRVRIICPICQSSKPVPVPADVIKKKETGATSVYIPSGMVCEHEFYAYIDKNFAVRDYLVLEYSLQDETKKAERLKNEIIKKADSLNLEYDNLMNYIEEWDLRSLLYSCFIESHIVLLEDDVDSERFGVLFNILNKLFPQMMATATLYTPQGFLKYKENNPIPDGITVYNVPFKLSVTKPFGETESESFDKILQILKDGPHKLQIIYAKNYIDYLRKFSEEVIDYPVEETIKISKILKKRHPDHEDKFNPELIRVMRKRNNFRLMHNKSGEIEAKPMIELVEEHLSGNIYIYNESIPVVHLLRREYGSEIERYALKIIRLGKKMDIKKLIQKLQAKEKELNQHFDYSKLPEIMNDFIDQKFVHIR